MGRTSTDKPGGIRGMNSNKAHSSAQETRVYQIEDRIYERRKLLRFKAITGNIVQNALKKLDEICIEEMQGDKPSPSRMEKYSLLHHYLDYLKRFCEGKA
jgi:hypothetical protein